MGKHPQLLDDWDDPGWPVDWRPLQAAFGSASRFVGIAEATDRADDTWDANQFITLDDQKQISNGTGAAGIEVPDQSDVGA